MGSWIWPSVSLAAGRAQVTSVGLTIPTGERIRDKIAASKRKGMWMGGRPPLGYDAVEQRLVINADEAATVLRMFQRYLELRSVPRLTEELAATGVHSKQWVGPVSYTHLTLPTIYSV